MATTIDGVASPQSNYEKYKDMFQDKHDLITMENFYELLVASLPQTRNSYPRWRALRL